MAKGFGIAALVFAIIAIFLPFGIVLTGIALVCATIAALAGDRGFTIATLVIGLVNTLFLSPSTWIMLNGGDPAARGAMLAMIAVGVALPIIGIALNASGKLKIQS